MALKDDVKALQRRVGVKDDGDFGAISVAGVNRALDECGYRKAVPAPVKAELPGLPGIQPKQTRRTIRRIVVHCSATPEGKDFSAADIDRWHRNQGWSSIGYNAVVKLDGTLERGRDESAVPSHAAGFNADSIAICYIGGVAADGKPKDTRTEAQKGTLLLWLREKRRQYPDAEILGHTDLPGVAKACPSFNAKREYADL